MFEAQALCAMYRNKGKVVTVEVKDGSHTGVFASVEWFRNYLNVPKDPPDTVNNQLFAVCCPETGNYLGFFDAAQIISVTPTSSTE